MHVLGNKRSHLSSARLACLPRRYHDCHVVTPEFTVSTSVVAAYDFDRCRSGPHATSGYHR